MSKLVKGQAYLLNDGGNWLRRFMRYADNGDDLVMADSNGTESVWDCACLVRKLSEEEVAGWPNCHKTDMEAQLAQHKQVIADMVAALEVFSQPIFQKELGGNVQGDASIVFARNDSVLTIGDFKRAAVARAKALNNDKGEK